MLEAQIFPLENRVYGYFHFREITSISKRNFNRFYQRNFIQKIPRGYKPSYTRVTGERKFEEKEIAEGVREMNFRKIFFMETTGDRRRKTGEGNRGDTKQVFGWYKFDGLPL